MPKNADLFKPDHRIQRYLYLESIASQVSYSDKPSGAIDPQRLLAGQPAFINTTDHPIKTKKTIVIQAPGLLGLGEDSKLYALHERILLLNEDGFNIYLCHHSKEKLKLIDKPHFPFTRQFIEKTRHSNRRILTTSQLSKILQLPSDLISNLHNTNEINEFIDGDDSDWERFAPYVNIKLNNSPINAKRFNRLLHRHGSAIKSLTITNCRHLDGRDIDETALSTLKNLEEFSLSSPETSDLKVEYILYASKKIKILSLYNSPIDLKLKQDQINLDELKKLELHYCYLSTKHLQTIINSATNIESLQLINIPAFIDSESLFISPKKLKVLDLRIVDISAKFLEAFLWNVENLRELTIYRCEQLGSITFQDVNFNKLTYINLDYSFNVEAILFILKNANNIETLHLTSINITINALQKILENAKNISHIYLRHCQQLKNGTLSNLNLNKLKHLDLSYSNISATNLQALLENAINIESLDLTGCNELDDGELHNIYLNKLKVFTLADHKISASNLHTLLLYANNIEVLDLTNVDQSQEKILLRINSKKLKDITLGTRIDQAINLALIIRRATNAKNIHIANQNPTSMPLNIDIYSTNLSGLTLLSLTIDASTLLHSLKRSKNISYLKLNYCHLKGSTLPRPIDLSKLKRLTISDCTLTATFLQSILENVKKLYYFEFSRCSVIEDRKLGDIKLKKLENILENKYQNIHILNIISPPNAHYEPTTSPEQHTKQVIQTRQNTIGAIFNPTPLNNSFHVDADTHLDQSTTLFAKRVFIGHSSSPSVKNYRIDHYDTLIFSTSNDIKDAFSLDKTNALELHDHHAAARSNEQLYHTFRKKSAGYYFGRSTMTLTDQWQALPSISSTESLTSYWISSSDDISIKKSARTHFHYIRLNKDSVNQHSPVTIEMILHCPTESASYYNTLPTEIKNLVRDCRGYRSEDLEVNTDNMTSRDYLNAIIQQRTGACRHRSIAFMHVMREKFPTVNVQLIKNDVHTFVEVFHNNIWISCDLGGYVSKIDINDSLLPEHTNHDHNEPLRPPEEIYTQLLSRRGKPLPHGYLNKTVNLVSLQLDDINSFPQGLLQLWIHLVYSAAHSVQTS